MNTRSSSPLIPCALAGLAYAVVAWLFLSMAPMQGYAAPLNPAAGIALAAVLVWGPAAAAAVAIGSLLVHAGLGNLGGAPGWSAMALPVLVAAGAGLQAWLGAYLVRRHNPGPLLLDTPRAVARFFALAALLASVITPSIALPVLAARASLPVGELAFTWWIWWVGEALGVLIGAPLTLTLIGRPRDAWAQRRWVVGLPLAVATMLTALAIQQIGQWYEARLQARFESDAKTLGTRLTLGLRSHTDALDAMHSVFIASDAVDDVEFHQAAESWVAKVASLQAIGWHQRVRRTEVPALEAEVRASGLSNFKVFERDPALTVGDADMLVARQAEPLAGNTVLLGLNVLSIPQAREALQRARAGQGAVASRPFALTQSADGELGVVLYRLVDRPDTAGRPATSGAVFVTVKLQGMLASMLNGEPAYAQTCLIDTTDPAAQQLAGPRDCLQTPTARLLRHETVVPIGGREWTLRVTARRSDAATALGEGTQEATWLFSLTGLTAAAMMGMLLLIVTGRTQRIEIAVLERTAALEQEMSGRRDIERALRDSEQRFRNIFHSVPVGVVYTDLDGRIRQPNAAMTALSGYSDTELGRMSMTQLLHPQDQPEHQRLRQSLVTGAAAGYRRRQRLRTKDGCTLEVNTSISVLRNEAGEPRRLVGVIEDISEHLRLEQAERAREAAEASSHAKSDFLSRMSHELRTPLNAMLGFAQLLELDRSSPLDERHGEWVKQIQHAGWHLLDMINDVLDLSRIESGNLRLEPVALSLRAVLDDSLSLVEAAAAQRGVKLAVPDDDAIAVMADPTRLKQVLTNLLSNAVKYNRPGGRVSVGMRRLGTLTAELTVRDTGLGMSESQLKQLFQPFNRLGRERSGTEGTGIGLVIAKLLAERMGGTLSAVSTDGVGSTFTLTLPLAPEDSPVLQPAPRHADEPDYHRRLVLYIEDNETNVEVMRGIFAQRPQVDLAVATNGLDGLNQVRQANPDLVLLDMHLPDIEGMELLQHLKADPETSDIPVVIVSADAVPAHIQAALAAGAERYLTKPVAVGQMLSVIDALLEAMITRYSTDL